MNMIELARDLKRTGFTQEQSELVATSVYKRGTENLATKDDIKLVKKDIEGVQKDIEGVQKDIEGVQKDIEGVEQRLDAKIECVQKDIEGVEQRLEAKIQPLYWILGFVVSLNLGILFKLLTT